MIKEKCGKIVKGLGGLFEVRINDDGVISRLSCRAKGALHRDEEKLFIITKLESTPQDLRYIIRGHFLMRVIYNLFYTLLKNYGYSEQFSMNDFYYAIVDECQAKCNCTDMRHLKEKIESAVKCLQKHAIISEGALGVGE